MDLHKLLNNTSSRTAHIQQKQQTLLQLPRSSAIETNMLPSFMTLVEGVDNPPQKNSQSILNRFSQC
jgi:hypothetical protein